jgi:hypothetical protein
MLSLNPLGNQGVRGIIGGARAPDGHGKTTARHDDARGSRNHQAVSVDAGANRYREAPDSGATPALPQKVP